MEVTEKKEEQKVMRDRSWLSTISLRSGKIRPLPGSWLHPSCDPVRRSGAINMYKLLQPDPACIEPRQHPPTHDRAPDEVVQGSPAWLRDDMVDMLGKAQVHHRAIDLIRFA